MTLDTPLQRLERFRSSLGDDSPGLVADLAVAIGAIESQEKKFSWIKLARNCKKIGQGAIGIGIVLWLALKLLSYPLAFVFPDTLEKILRLPTLDVIAYGLQYAAALDLAYMLFTPGPDEAVQPLMLGLAAAALLEVSHLPIGPDNVLAAAIFCLLIGFLLYIQRRFKLQE